LELNGEVLGDDELDRPGIGDCVDRDLLEFRLGEIAKPQVGVDDAHVRHLIENSNFPR